MQLRRPESTAGRFGSFVLLGALAVLAFAPVGAFWLAPLVALALFAGLRRCATPREAAWRGFAFGAGYFLVGISWIYVSLSVFGGMPFWLAGPATVIFCLAMALYPALASWIFRRWQPANEMGAALFFAATFVAIDWLRGWFLSGFPWLLLGHSQTPPSPLAGYAPMLGVHGLTFLVLLIGALLRHWRLGLLVTLAIIAGGQLLRDVAWTQAQGEPVTVALVQGNVPQEMKFRPEAFLRTLHHYAELIDRHPAQLTVLPETAFPAFFDQLPEDYLVALRRLVARTQGDLLIGSVLGDPLQYWNGAISLGQSPQQSYRKQHLVPFGETIPPGFSWFMAMANIPMSSFSAGEPPQPILELAGQRIAVNICYEDVFGEALIGGAREAGLLVNLSNTAWFGKSLAQFQHLQIARLRALETGRPMLRATNTGMTAIIDPHGNVEAQLPAFTTGVLGGTVRSYAGLTPYLRFGNLTILTLIGLIFAGVTLSRARQPT